MLMKLLGEIKGLRAKRSDGRSIKGEDMADAVKLLEARVELLERDIREMQVTLVQLRGKKIEASAPPAPAKPPVPEDASEEILSWVNQSSLLPQLATLCFLLVVALMLRTVTDNDILDKQLGSLLGMTYAAALIGYGWYNYRRSSPLAPVFTICGAALMFTIIVETHAHFASLPSIPAYLLLMCTAAAMAGISYRFRIALPMLVGTLGMCIAAFAVNYPNPIFPYLVLLLLFANILGFFATRLQRCSWLRWIILGLTVFTFQVWAVKLGLSLSRKVAVAGQALPWFLPMVALLSAIYLAISLYGILKDNSGKISRFDFSLPTINVIWAFLAMRYVLTARGENIILLGMFGAAVAAAYLFLAFWLGRRKIAGAPGTNTFTLAGSVLLILSLPLAAAGYALAYLPILAGAALAMAHLSAEWRSGGVRVTALLLQLYVGIALGLALHGHDSAGFSFAYAPATGMAALCALLQFHWCRKTAPPKESQIYSPFDKEDRSAVLLFMVALINGFLMLRVLLFLALTASPGDVANAFACIQSVVINASAAGLMLFAFFRRNKEIRSVALLVILIGGGNVFLSDLFATRGFPLVASVFSFGLAVALDSVILSRWQRLGNPTPGKTT